MPQSENAVQGVVIRNGALVNNDWLSIADAAALAAAPADAAVLVPLELWLSARAAVLAHARRAVLLAPTAEPEELAEDLAVFEMIAIEFPQFTDGRGYSIGRLLRERFGFRGELRAVGDVQRDQLFYLVRCGFDAFVLRADKNPAKALDAYRDFSEAYQAAVDQPVPLFRRRGAILAGAAQ